MARLVLLSDTHGLHEGLELPAGDVLIHAGDLTRHGTLAEVEAFGRWLAFQPHPHKVVVPGNHDEAFLHSRKRAHEALGLEVHLLIDGGVELAGLTLWGSPFHPEAGGAFGLSREALDAHWSRLPDGLDVLVTHGPPRGLLDRSDRGAEAGCVALRREVERKAPRLHVFGHIHDAAGEARLGPTRLINAAQCVGWSGPLRPARVVELPPPGSDEPEKTTA